MLTIAVYGHKNSGKTALITSLVRELNARGYKVAVLKHIHHGRFEVDVRGKDTWRHREAGAVLVAGISSDILFLVDTGFPSEESALDFVLDVIERRGGIDLLFLEGFKEVTSYRRDIYKIILLKDGEVKEDLFNDGLEPENILGYYYFLDSSNKEKIKDELIEKILKLKNLGKRE